MIILRYINALIRKGNWFNNKMFADCNKFWSYKQFNTDVVNLGSTSALHAFDYSGLKIIGANFALGHNPLLADFAILKNYLSYIKPNGGHVIITLCPFSVLSGSYDYLEDRYYTILYPSSMPTFSYARQQQVKSMMKNPLSVYPLIALLSDIKNFIIKSKDKELSESEMEANATIFINSWKHEFSIDNFSEPLSLKNTDGLNDAADLLNSMIEFCKQRDLTPSLVIPPLYHTLAEKFDIDARQVLIDNLIAKIKDKSVIFTSYMDDERFSNDRTLFKNSFILNKKGAKTFTTIVLNDLNIMKGNL